MSNYEQEMQIIREAAHLAAELCLAVRREMLGDDSTRIEKAGKEPVTVADYGAQAVVLQQVSQHFPDDASIAEERTSDFDTLATETQHQQVVDFVSQTLDKAVSLEDIRTWLDFGRDKTGSRIWTVDPIDGTKGFLRGEQFAVAVALLIDGIPMVGALACPLLPVDPSQPEGEKGVIALAVRGGGATIEPLSGGEPRSLAVSSRSEMAEIRTVESVESGHTDHSFSGQVLKRIGAMGGAVRMDSQAKYVAVADGRGEVYLRNSRGVDYREKIWDHAAGVLIVEEAGGRITDLNGESLDFTFGEKLANNRGILATNIHPHNALLESIKVQDAQS